MRKFILAAAVITVSGFIVTEAMATRISFTATVQRVRAACSTAGGSFGVHIDGGGYGCTKKNCDGKGGTCQVQCDNGNNCTGTSPGRIVSYAIESIMTNGTYATSGNAGTSGSAAPGGGNILGSSPGMGASGPSATGNPVDKPKMPAAPIPQIR